MPKKKSRFGPSGYRGCKVSLKLVREGLKTYEPVSLTDSREVYEFMKDLEDFDREAFYTLHIDLGGKVISCEEVAKGNNNACIINPGDVYKSALLSSADSVIFVHNHPSGNPVPSVSDVRLHDTLLNAGDLLNINVLDSVIIGHGKYYSFADKGTLRKKKEKG